MIADMSGGVFWVPSLEELGWFGPELALVGTLVALLVAPLVTGRRTPAASATVTVIGCAVALLVLFGGIGKFLGQPDQAGVGGLAPTHALGMLVVDNVALYFKAVVIVFLMLITGMWWMGSGRRESNAPEFFVLLVGSALGMILMTSTVHLLMLIIAIELASLPSYAMVGFDKSDRRGAEASLKYVIFGAVSAAIMIYGASLLYGLYGSMNLGVIGRAMLVDLTNSNSDFAVANQNNLIIGLALFCLMAGIGFKISAVPFHFWCPDAFEGAKIEVTTWLSVPSKAAGILLLVRVLHSFSLAAFQQTEYDALLPVAWGVGILAILTCTWGNFAAYRQTSVKRMLAYSSIAHAGYMLMAATLLVNPVRNMTYGMASTSGITAILVYIVLYLFMNLGAFGVTAMVVWSTGSDSIESFTGLIRRAPWLAVPMVLCLVSLVGLPPLGGFIGKWWILMALGGQGSVLAGVGTLYWILVCVAVVNTLISLFYYMRVVRQMTLRDDGREAVVAPAAGVWMVNLCGIFLLVAGIFLPQRMKTIASDHTMKMFRPVTNVESGLVASADVMPADPDQRIAQRAEDVLD